MNKDIKRWLEKDGTRFLKDIGIKEGQTVLDFGCGEGHYAIPAAKVVGRQGKIYALDKDRSALDKLKSMMEESSIKNIVLINENSKVPLGNNSLDVVLCFDVIHYGNKKERKLVYEEIHRVLIKDGLFSVYPKHRKEDYPLMELADTNLKSIVKEIQETGFILDRKFSKTLLHDDCYNEGYTLNFKKEA